MNTSVSRVNPGRRHALTRPTPVRARSHETQGRRGKSSPLFKCQGSWRAKSTMDPWQRGRREHPRAGNPRSLLVPRSQVKLAWPRVVPQFESGGRRASCRALRAMGIARRTASAARKTRTTPTPYRTERTSVPGPDSTGARSQSTKPPARICHRRLNTQGMPRIIPWIAAAPEAARRSGGALVWI
jgi:hypothetical protein